MKISDGLKVAAWTVFGSLLVGTPVVGYLNKLEWEEGQMEWQEAQIQRQTRTDIIGTVRSTDFEPSAGYFGTGIGWRPDRDTVVGYGLSKFALSSTDAQLKFTIESS